VNTQASVVVGGGVTGASLAHHLAAGVRVPRPADAMERRAPALLDLRRTAGRAGLREVTPDHHALIG
jgi:glycine/D-amino acid oxidase-like deaminating enzyme